MKRLQERPEISTQQALDISQPTTPYELTLSALIVPWSTQTALNLVFGLAFAFVAGPLLGAAWVASLCLADCALRPIYRRWSLSAVGSDSDRGLRRLAWIAAAKSAIWVAIPTAFILATRSPESRPFLMVLVITLCALATSTARNSSLVFLAMVAPMVVATAIGLTATLGLASSAGVLLATGIMSLVLWRISTGTNHTVAAWNQAALRASVALAETRKALDRSEAAERRLALAIRIADLHVYEVDLAGGSVVTLGNDNAFLDYPLSFEMVVGGPCEIVHPQDRPAVQAAWARYEAGEAPYQVEYRVNRQDGREMWASSVAEVIRDPAGRQLAMVGALKDITDRKLIERDLIDARDRAEAASNAKSDFLATVSHEIRTPLNGVLGMAQAMEADDLSPAQRTRLDVIRRSGRSLLTLLNSVLDISKMEADQFELEDGTLDIAEVARGALDSFGGAAAEKGLALVLDVTPLADGAYAGDPARVSQILGNLISNAVKFTEAGSVLLTVDRPDEALVIRLKDTGIGIAPGQTQGLFDKFVQADASVTRRYGGSGLGLTICRELVLRMGGSVDLESEPGCGSTFTVTLPLARLAQSPEIAEAPSGPGDGAGAEPRAIRVLVAEDNPTNQLVLRALLAPVGIDPVIVGDGQQALIAWRRGEWDVILMDVQMPVMDGVTATRMIRDEEAASGRARTPIVGVTANVMTHQVKGYRAAGMDDVVPKPVEFRRLVEAIEASLPAEPAECSRAA
jgi:signal transduction histidine kinase/CheY-like chemotaxis protein